MTLKTTPAVAAGVVQSEWTMDDLVEMMEWKERTGQLYAGISGKCSN